MYAVTHGTFRTPRGRNVSLAYREDTNDYNTLHSCLDEDEYRLKDLHLDGTALDIGAHIGGVTVALAVDNPDLRVIAVEGVPPNVDLLNENLQRTGVAQRVEVIANVAGDGESAIFTWGYTGNVAADHHSFVGNAVMPEVDLRATHSVEGPTLSLETLVRDYGPFTFAKVDCEGCEFAFLQGPALQHVNLIRGEIHYPNPEAFADALESTHELTLPATFPGAFEAVRRG